MWEGEEGRGLADLSGMACCCVVERMGCAAARKSCKSDTRCSMGACVEHKPWDGRDCRCHP